MNRRSAPILSVFALLATCAANSTAARAAIVIDVGNHLLQPETPNQPIAISVSGGDPVQGLNLFAQVADGGPDEGGITIGPKITAADVLTGTIFATNNLGQFNPGSSPQLAVRFTLTASGSVPATGLLVTLTFDTTNIPSGTYPLSLSNTLEGSTDFADDNLPLTILNGSLTVLPIPEPTSLALFAPLSLALLLRRR